VSGPSVTELPEAAEEYVQRQRGLQSYWGRSHTRWALYSLAYSMEVSCLAVAVTFSRPATLQEFDRHLQPLRPEILADVLAQAV
jgi:hypothetical protein